MSYRPESHQLAGEHAVRGRDGGRPADHYDHHHPHANNPARGGAPATRDIGRANPQANRPPPRTGRQVRLGRVAFWTIVGTLVLLAAWTTLSATYLAFHDDALRRLMKHQAEVQSSYEDRIAEMRMRIDRAASREKVDQDQISTKLEQIVKRQTILEGRANMLGTLADPSGAAGKSRKPDAAGNDKGAWLEPRGFSALFARLMGRKPDPAAVLARLNELLDRVDTRETATLAAMEENFEGKAQRLRTALNDVGVRVGKPEGIGGPFIPVKLVNDGNFERHVARIHQARAHLERLTRTLATVPLRKPVEGELDEVLRFRRAHGPVHRQAGDAHRDRLPRRQR